MTTQYRAPRALLPLVVVTLMAGLGTASAAPVPPTGWHTLFPPVSAYPLGTRLLALETATRATALVDPDTATQITRLGFVAGGLQYATLPKGAVASVTVFTFRTTRGAATFLRQDHPTALADPTTPGTVVGGLGDGARYVAGACATCGTGAPPVGILLERRGAAVVQVLTQPTDHALALRLGHAALHQ